MDNKNNRIQRWYDKDPTLSLAVSFINNASKEKQQQIAEKIIEKAVAAGVKINELKVLFDRRWFDEDEKLRIAMEYLKESTKENQHLIALEIINFLTEIK